MVSVGVRFVRNYFNSWKELSSLPNRIWVIFITCLINRMGTMVLPFLMIYLTNKLGLSSLDAGIILSVYGITALITSPISGIATDHVGFLPVAITSLILSGACLLVYPLANNFSELCVLTFFFASTNEAFRPAVLAGVTEMVDHKHRRPAFALIRLAINLGMSVGPAVGGFLAQSSFTSLFMIDGLTTLAAASVLFLCKAKMEDKKVRIRKIDMEVEQWGLFSFFAFFNANFLLFLLAVVPVKIVFYQQISSLPLYFVSQLGFSIGSYGLLFTLNTLMIVVLEVPINFLTSRMDIRTSLVLGSICFAIGFGSLVFAKNMGLIFVTVAIWTFGEMFLFPGMSAYVSSIAPSKRNGQYMGLYSMMTNLALTLGPSSGILVFNKFGSNSLWLMTAILGLSSAFLFSCLNSSNKSYLKE